MAHRTQSVPHVSTEKMSESIPSVVAKGRFDGLRDQHEMRKELAKAKKEYVQNPTKENHNQIKRARAEKAKTEGKK